MKILFVFGGALTAYQESVIDKCSMSNDVMVSSSADGHEYDLLVVGSGVRLPDGLSGKPFMDYAKELEVEKVKKKKSQSSGSKTAASSEAE